MSDEEGNLEADIAADSEYSHSGGNDPRSDFLYGVLSERRFSMRTAFIFFAPWGLFPRGHYLAFRTLLISDLSITT